MKYKYFLTHEQLYNLPNCKPSWQKVYRYAMMMENGQKFPPVNIFFDKKKNEWRYNDGRHRVIAAKMCGLPLLVKSSMLMGKKKINREVNL